MNKIKNKNMCFNVFIELMSNSNYDDFLTSANGILNLKLWFACSGFILLRLSCCFLFELKLFVVLLQLNFSSKKLIVIKAKVIIITSIVVYNLVEISFLLV
jgi:hypothetical protein